MINYHKPYSHADMQAIVFGRAKGYSFKLIASSMFRTEYGVRKAFTRAMQLPMWQETFNEYKIG